MCVEHNMGTIYICVKYTIVTTICMLNRLWAITYVWHTIYTTVCISKTLWTLPYVYKIH